MYVYGYSTYPPVPRYFYPGANAPISSIRWEALRDGLEDAELLLRACDVLGRATVLPIVRRVIQTPTDRDLRPETLEAARREVAQLLIRVQQQQ